MAKLILASGSPRRKDLLTSIGFAPDAIIPPDIDETPKKGEKPLAYTKRLAKEKAEAIQKDHPNDVVIAADTTVITRGKILGKPEDAAEARKFLKMLSGRQHTVITGICVKYKDTLVLKTAQTKVKFSRISPEELDFMIASNEWVGKAGGYMIQGIVAAFVISINGSVSNVIGLPLHIANNALWSAGLRPK
ncbi:MAG: Maf family protein [Rickettsiales bacterium]